MWRCERPLLVATEGVLPQSNPHEGSIRQMDWPRSQAATFVTKPEC